MVSGDGNPGGERGCGPAQGREPCSSLPSVTSAPLADYQTLRIGGLVFAVVLFSVGILLILSKFVPSLLAL